MTKNCQISVIIPLYNVEEYVKRCVKHFNLQTLNPELIEYIFIDDGCIDNSVNLVHENIDPSLNYKVYSKKNGGLSDARNYGLSYANGKYISFIDSDDYIEPEFFSKMLSKIQTSDFDFVMCETNWIYEKKQVVCSNKLMNTQNKDEMLDNLFKSSIAAWNKLYKRTIFDEFKFTKGLAFEDLDFMFQICDKYNKIGFINEPLYNYVQGRNTSIINVMSSNDFDSYEKIFDYAIKKYKHTEYFKYVEQYFIRRIILSCSKKYLNTIFENKLKIMVKKYVKYFPNYKENFEYQNNSKLLKFWTNQVIEEKYFIIKIIKQVMI